MNASTRSPRPDYGIDAPGVRRTMFILGCGALCVLALPTLLRLSAGARTGIEILAVVVATYGLFMAAYMTYGSRIGKLRTREMLLDRAGTLRPWTGAETVLDVGCGRGLMLIGAALRLNTGRATGIDLWRSEDQNDNSPEAAHANACIEGVDDRIQIDTGDARHLPYAAGQFDLVLSHWVLHNLPTAQDRRQALDEILRVLRPGGVLVLADIAHIEDYRAHLRKGTTNLRILSGGAGSVIMGILSGGSFRPQALLAIRAHQIPPSDEGVPEKSAR